MVRAATRRGRGATHHGGGGVAARGRRRGGAAGGACELLALEADSIKLGLPGGADCVDVGDGGGEGGADGGMEVAHELVASELWVADVVGELCDVGGAGGELVGEAVDGRLGGERRWCGAGHGRASRARRGGGMVGEVVCEVVCDGGRRQLDVDGRTRRTARVWRV